MSNVTPLFKKSLPTKIVVIEGVDGVGKATQTQLLCSALEKKGFSVVDFSFPDYDKPWGVFIKKMLSNETALNPNGVLVSPTVFHNNPYIKSMAYLDNFAETYLAHSGITSSISGAYKKDFIVFDRYVPSMIAFAYASCVCNNQKMPVSNKQHDWKKVMEFINCYFLGVKIDLQINLIADLNATKANLDARYKGHIVTDVHEQDTDLMRVVSELYRLNKDFIFEPIDSLSPDPSLYKHKPRQFFNSIYHERSDIDVINCMGTDSVIRSKEDIAKDVMTSVENYFQLT